MIGKRGEKKNKGEGSAKENVLIPDNTHTRDHMWISHRSAATAVDHVSAISVGDVYSVRRVGLFRKAWSSPCPCDIESAQKMRGQRSHGSCTRVSTPLPVNVDTLL